MIGHSHVVKMLIESFPDVSVVVPAFDEEGNISQVISELLKVKEVIPNMEIIVVDDYSSDGTVLKLMKFKSITLILHLKNMGKGAALRTGFKAAKGRVVVIQDADMEYFPGEIPNIVRPILSGKADVVYGSRFNSKPSSMSFMHFLGNMFLSLVASLLYGKRITDIMTGHKAFSNKVIDSVDLKEDGFAVEVELTAQILQNGWKFFEVPIGYTYRPNGVSKIRNIDGLKSFIRLVVNALKGQDSKRNNTCKSIQSELQRKQSIGI
jgi:glycosyltransferase involved in cell wall biosynthesis